MGKLQKSYKVLLAFANNSKSVGIILIICTILSLILTNSAIGESYKQIWLQKISENKSIPENLEAWINDGLMAIFFFIAGLEIKKELLVGELNSLKKAALPIFSAVGGVVIPALIYFLLNKGTAFENGWGVPTATDIAFSLGIASLVSMKLFPDSMRVFLMALAIIDDLIAVLIVAVFYGGNISLLYVAIAIFLIFILYRLFRKKLNNVILIVGGILLWVVFFKSGIHSTFAGVTLAFCIPVQKVDYYLHRLHIPVNFLIIPLFALANTCISIPSDFISILSNPLFLGVFFGLFIGKPIGILATSLILVKLKWANLPSQSNWGKMCAAGILAGIGFTMSIFISTLAFEKVEIQDISKIGVLVGSTLSMLLGYIWMRISGKSISKLSE